MNYDPCAAISAEARQDGAIRRITLEILPLSTPTDPMLRYKLAADD